MDRLDEIEARLASHANPFDDQTRWVIDEVRRLRDREEDLLQQLAHATTENALLRRLDIETTRCFCNHCRHLRDKAFGLAEVPERGSTAEASIRVP